jgi:hypothetical protein
VCLFCLTDNIFSDERSILLLARAVKLGKQCATRARARARVRVRVRVRVWVRVRVRQSGWASSARLLV